MTADPRAEIALAVNAARGIPRSAACRLVAELDRWWPAEGRAAAALALELGVPEPALAAARRVAREAPERALVEREHTAALGATVVTRFDAAYPVPLLELPLPPPALYVRGELPAGPVVAIVGTRRPSLAGVEAAELFGFGLAQVGVTVLSGFARGIDGAAHRGALASGRPGATVAVLGCGLGDPYPRQHRELGERIVAAGGALVTELPCGTPPRPWQFPVRNRVIAGWSRGTLVVEAAPRSGSLITARLALELGREVWAVPGSIFEERALGPNGLIRDGAPPVLHPRDLLDALPLPVAAPSHREEPAAELPPGLAGRLLQALADGAPRTVEDLSLATGAQIDQVLGELLELELAARVRREPGPLYRRG
jgi:DNA processing protein